MPGTVTIPDVPILRVGTWGGSNDGKAGPVIVTADHLADMVAAATDPDIDTAPLKIGHTGTLSDLADDDSEPALGWAANLRLSDDGQTLLADYTDVPAALEEPIKAAYKRRSAEIAWQVKTTAGKAYTAVLDGLALLGVKKPAVKGLADLAELYGTATLATAGRDVGSHSVLSLYDIAPDEPTQGERIRSCVEYAKRSAAELGAMVGLAGLQAVFDALDAMVPADSRGLLAAAPHHDPVTTATTPGGTMPKQFSSDEITKARMLLGLDDKTTDDQVVAKLSELGDLVTEQKTPAGDSQGGTTTDGTPAGELAAEPATAGAALSAAVIDELKKAGLTVLPVESVEQLQANAALGAAAATTLSEQRRDTVLDQAQRDGKFGAGETAEKIRSKLSEQLDTNFDGTKALIDLMPQIVPVGEVGTALAGHQTASALSAAEDAAWDAWEADVFGTTDSQEA